jgi:nucleotide-binding universal stress UspA family protein
MPTVVLGDDRSPSSDLALSWIEQQRWSGWRLEIVQAEMPPFGPPVPPEEAQLHEWNPPEPRQVAPATDFAEVVHLQAKADPRVVLLREVDLLVIGPRGKGLLKSLHLGSVAEWIIARPASPTVLVRSGAKVDNVVVAYDGSTSALAAVRGFAALPWASDAGCVLAVVDDGRVDVAKATSDAQGVLEGGGVSVEVAQGKGSPTAVLSGEIERRDPDLVVMGTRGHTGFSRLHLGSTASAIVRSAHCSVMVACADGTSADR